MGLVLRFSRLTGFQDSEPFHFCCGEPQGLEKPVAVFPEFVAGDPARPCKRGAGQGPAQRPHAERTAGSTERVSTGRESALPLKDGRSLDVLCTART